MDSIAEAMSLVDFRSDAPVLLVTDASSVTVEAILDANHDNGFFSAHL